MKKGFKGLMGLCLVAGLAIGGTKCYALASTSFSVDGAWGGCRAGETTGTAYTSVSGETSCYGSVTACFYGYTGAQVVFNLGDSAGGVHGAGVSVVYNGVNGNATITQIDATHIANVYGKNYTRHTDDIWYE